MCDVAAGARGRWQQTTTQITTKSVVRTRCDLLILSLSLSSFLFFFVSPFIASTNITLAVNSHWRWWSSSSSSFVYAVRARLSLWSSFDDDDALCIYMMTKEWTKWNIKKKKMKIAFILPMSAQKTQNGLFLSLSLSSNDCVRVSTMRVRRRVQGRRWNVRKQSCWPQIRDAHCGIRADGSRMMMYEVWRENTCVDEFMCMNPLAAAASHRRLVMCFFYWQSRFAQTIIFQEISFAGFKWLNCPIKINQYQRKRWFFIARNMFLSAERALFNIVNLVAAMHSLTISNWFHSYLSLFWSLLVVPVHSVSTQYQLLFWSHSVHPMFTAIQFNWIFRQYAVVSSIRRSCVHITFMRNGFGLRFGSD